MCKKMRTWSCDMLCSSCHAHSRINGFALRSIVIAKVTQSHTKIDINLPTLTEM